MVIAAPLFDGAVYEIMACVSPAVAVPITGASGAIAGVTEFEDALATLIPMALVAVTVKV